MAILATISSVTNVNEPTHCAERVNDMEPPYVAVILLIVAGRGESAVISTRALIGCRTIVDGRPFECQSKSEDLIQVKLLEKREDHSILKGTRSEVKPSPETGARPYAW